MVVRRGDGSRLLLATPTVLLNPAVNLALDDSFVHADLRLCKTKPPRIGVSCYDVGMIYHWNRITWYTFFALCFAAISFSTGQELDKNLGLQLEANPPMQVIARTPPEPEIPSGDFETRKGYQLISNLDDFRQAIKQDGQKIRLKPGIYRVETPDEPHEGKQHLLAVHGSNNHFDLRGTVIETPVSAQGRLASKAHTSSCWRVYGSKNTFIGGYFRNVLDQPYPKYRVADSEFEILGDNNRFYACTFVIQGSIPYGYSDYYGKGDGGRAGRLDKHSCMGVINADGNRIEHCKIYQHSFGHAVHLHSVNGFTVKDCFISGALRPTNDIYKEESGRAKENNFNIVYRGERPIPRDEMIPLTESGIRTYEEVQNLQIKDTTVERTRGCYALYGVGKVHLENATAREAGDFAFAVTSTLPGKATMKDCHADLAYNPVFNFTRGPLPTGNKYEITIHDPPDDSSATPRTGLGEICGDKCRFEILDATTKPLPEGFDRLMCGSKKRPLTNSKVINRTTATVALDPSVQNCTIHSAGPVIDQGQGNRIIKIRARKKKKTTTK